MLNNLNVQYHSIFSNPNQPFWNKSEIPKDTNDAKCESFIYFSKKRQTYQNKQFQRIGAILVKCNKNGEKLWCDLSNSILESINVDPVGQGIRIFKNNKVLEFFGYVDQWYKELKKYCILQNIKNQYKIGKKIGHGTFADVYHLTRYSDNMEFAVKIYNKQSEKFNLECIMLELEIWRKMDHVNVNQLIETYESKQYIFAIQELCSFGTLDQMLSTTQFTEDEVIKGIYKLLEALVSIHSKGIIHRDIKPENILLRNLDEMVISDFGIADYQNEKGLYKYQRSGTPGNMAPEVLQDKCYNCKVDVYGIGIIFYQMLTSQQSPFYCNDYEQIVQRNREGHIDFSEIKCSQQVLTLLKIMLDPNPNNRLTAQQAKQDKVFKKYNRQTIIIKRKKFIQDQTFCSFSPRSTSIYLSPPHYKTPPVKIQSPFQNMITNNRANCNPSRLKSFERTSVYSPRSGNSTQNNLKRTLKICTNKNPANKSSIYYLMASNKLLI